jgi:hypothetical protein
MKVKAAGSVGSERLEALEEGVEALEKQARVFEIRGDADTREHRRMTIQRWRESAEQ